jgi:hypothetical protein
VNRRIRLANEVIALGLAKPELPGEPNGPRTPQPQARVTAVPRQPGPHGQPGVPAQLGPAQGDRRGVTSQSGEPA